MNVAIVGRGRMGSALATSAAASGHTVTILRRAGGDPREHPVATEAELGPEVAWTDYDLVVLAFEMKVDGADAMRADPSMKCLLDIPMEVPVGSVVMTPASEVVMEFIARPITHFMTTPAIALEGAIAVIPDTPLDREPLTKAFDCANWFVTAPEDYLRYGMLMLGGAFSAVVLSYLAEMAGTTLDKYDPDFVTQALEDARRLLELSQGDGIAAFSQVATPGGMTEGFHNTIFKKNWPPADTP